MLPAWYEVWVGLELGANKVEALWWPQPALMQNCPGTLWLSALGFGTAAQKWQTMSLRHDVSAVMSPSHDFWPL